MKFRKRKKIVHKTDYATIKWQPHAFWSLDLTLASVIADALAEFQKLGNTYPFGVTVKEWEDILAEMEAGFRQFAEKNDDEATMAGLERSLELLKEHFTSLWD